MKNLRMVIAALAVSGVLSSSLVAQYNVKNVSMVSVNFAWGFYSPNPTLQAAWDPGDFGGLGFTGRALFGTRLFNSRLSLGGEYAFHTIASQENGGSYTLTYAGLPVSSGATKDLLLAHSVQVIGDYLAVGLESLDLHIGAGVGVVFFSGEKEQMTVPVTVPGTDISMMSSVPAESMDAEFSGSLRLVAAFPVARHTTLDPELRYFRSFGDQNISIVQVAVGISYWW